VHGAAQWLGIQSALKSSLLRAPGVSRPAAGEAKQLDEAVFRPLEAGFLLFELGYLGAYVIDLSGPELHRRRERASLHFASERL